MLLIARLSLLLVALGASGCSLLRPQYVPPDPWTTESGLEITDFLLPKGDGVVTGQVVSVHYTASLATGVQVDSSYDNGAPIEYTVGDGQVPAGFDEGVLGMTLGARRLVVAPPLLAFGVDGIPGVVPRNSTITFDLEMMEVGPPPPPPLTKAPTDPGVQPSELASQ